ncbi:recombinase family protein [Lacrimispora sp. BS-2]|uniref:Recombinase family protein n=1 Tax=Lacrimispora sp. BS-2 TaxID=3151850 RepID=A0AAU7PLN9_9FIRM
MELKSTGKEIWCKRTIDVMLSNEKYMGNVRLLDSITGDVEYLVKENNPRIISSNVFNRVHAEKKRSNVIKEEGGTVQKDKKYS